MLVISRLHFLNTHRSMIEWLSCAFNIIPCDSTASAFFYYSFEFSFEVYQKPRCICSSSPCCLFDGIVRFVASNSYPVLFLRQTANHHLHNVVGEDQKEYIKKLINLRDSQEMYFDVYYSCIFCINCLFAVVFPDVVVAVVVVAAD